MSHHPHPIIPLPNWERDGSDEVGDRERVNRSKGMIGQTISHTELTLWSSTSRVVDLSKNREGRIGLANTSSSLNLEKGNEGMSSSRGTE